MKIANRQNRSSHPHAGRIAATLSLAMAAAVGCQSASRDEAEPSLAELHEATTNQQIVQMSLHDQIRNATEIEGTIYPHYFKTNGTDLNPIGAEQFESLTATGRCRPLALNVPRGAASEQLYDGRLEGLRQRLEAAGFTSDQVTFLDKLPGGEGMSTEQVVQQAIREQAERGGRSGTGNTAASWQQAGGRADAGGTRGGGGGGGGRGSGRAGRQSGR
jgi:hypothetical protein